MCGMHTHSAVKNLAYPMDSLPAYHAEKSCRDRSLDQPPAFRQIRVHLGFEIEHPRALNEKAFKATKDICKLSRT